jgi:hypothetical protein
VVYNEIWKTGAAPTDSFSLQLPGAHLPEPGERQLLPGVDADLPHHHPLRRDRHASPGQIHPLWSVPRPRVAFRSGDGRADLSPDLHVLPFTYEPMDPAMPQLPAASLELTDEDLG